MPDEKVVWSEEIIMSCNVICCWTKKKVWSAFPSSRSITITNKNVKQYLKEVFAKNKMGYRLTAKISAFNRYTNLTSICCVYKEKIVKNDSYRRT